MCGLQTEVSELQGKVGTLEETLRDKDEELQKLKDADSMRDSVSNELTPCPPYLTSSRTPPLSALSGKTSVIRWKRKWRKPKP